MRRGQAKPLFDPWVEPKSETRACDHPGCAAEGAHRAPKDRSRLNEYYWFCLEHAREYNQAWDYYAGMSPDEIEKEMRRDTTWQRPTWPMGKWGKHERVLRASVVRGMGFEFSDTAPDDELERRRRFAETPEGAALAVLDLTPPVDFTEIKIRYRELVKQNHPDSHGGDKHAEERLKRINQAYTTLKACYGGS